MARSPTAGQRRKFAALIASLEPRLRAAFEKSVRNLKAGVRFPDLIRALEGGDVEAAIRALNIQPAAFYRYGAEKTAAFAEGGALTTTTINLGAGASIGIRFDMSNPGAERWIRQNVANRVTAIANEQVAMIRETIQTGYAAGRGPREIGRDIAGRVVNGTRQGGVIGLDGPRARSLNAVTRGMESAEGVRDLVVKGRDGNFRVRYKVNPATEKRILRAYNAGTAVPAADRAISVRQYENALLKARGDTIARTETAQAVRGAQMEQWSQLVEKGEVPAEAVIKRWIHSGGAMDPRPHHVAANGLTVRGLNTPFVLANGRSLMYPHDPGADGSETINCTCSHEVFRDPAYGMAGTSAPMASAPAPEFANVSAASKIKVGQNLSAAAKAANGKNLTEMISKFSGEPAEASLISGFLVQPNLFGVAKFKTLNKQWLASKATPPVPSFASFDPKTLGLPEIPPGAVASATKAANAKKVTAFFENKIKNNQWQALGKIASMDAADHISLLAKAGAFSKVKAQEFSAASAKLKNKAMAPSATLASAGSGQAARMAGRDQARKKDIDELLATPGLPKAISGADRTTLENIWNRYVGLQGSRTAPELSALEEAIIRTYTGSAFRDINKDLRSGKPSAESKLFAAITNHALTRVNSPKSPTTLYRGVGTAKTDRWEQALRSASPGSEIILRYDGINSFSKSVTTAKSFGSKGGLVEGQRVKGYIWQVEGAKRAKSVQKISNHPGEVEWLYSDGALFKVSKVEIPTTGSLSGFAVVTVREVVRKAKGAVIERAKVAGQVVPARASGGIVAIERTPRGDLRTARQMVVDDMLRKQVATGFEHAAVLGPGGKVIWSGTSGSRGSVRIRGLDQAAKGKRIEIHHTHPRDQSFSLEDLLLTSRNGRSDVWIYAHTAAGGRFKARALRDLDRVADRIDMSGGVAQQGVFKRLPNVSADANARLSWHIIMLALKRSGRIQYSSALSSEQALLVARIGRQGMNEIVNDVARFIGP